MKFLIFKVLGTGSSVPHLLRVTGPFLLNVRLHYNPNLTIFLFDDTDYPTRKFMYPPPAGLAGKTETEVLIGICRQHSCSCLLSLSLPLFPFRGQNICLQRAEDMSCTGR